MLTSNDLKKLLLLIDRATLQAKEAEEFVALKFRLQDAVVQTMALEAAPLQMPAAPAPAETEG